MKVVAKKTLWLLIAVNILVALFREESNEGLFSLYKETRFNIEDSSILSIVMSMFHHIDGSHLLSNMLGLLSYGTHVFVETSSYTWQSPITILSVYLGSGIGARYGLIGLASFLERQWVNRLRKNRRSAWNFCSQYWLCRKLGVVDSSWFRPIVDLYTRILHADQITALSLYKGITRIGASGAVFGVLGARLYTSIFSSYHNKLSSTEKLYFLAIICYEASLTPVQLDSLWDLFVMGDKIDHAGHLLGFLSGFMIAFCIHRLQSKRRNGRGYNYGAHGGRRLGSR
jgi:membrane associated rhomboid family serine protease